MMRPHRLALAALIAAWPGGAFAGGGESKSDVAAAVRQAAMAAAPPGASVSLGNLDGARAMQRCTVPLAVTVSGTVPYEQAAVHCASPGWTLYVTVTMAQSETVVVAARPLIPGQTLKPADLRLAALPVQKFAGRQVYFDPAQLIGATTDMALAAGMPLTADTVQAPIMVKAGQTVAVQVRSRGVQLTLDAKAQQTGRIGDTILLTNPGSGRRFTAEVTAAGVELVLR